MIELIDDAKSSIKVAMNVWSYKDISRALVRAKQRGVDVQIITIQSNKLQEAIAILTSGGIPIKWSESHYKWMLVDDYTFVNGSPN
ncbi:phospholipase D-like domain-containing protein [Parachlamydia acanthamoebae]|uniref:phospholipase D-like domain-containing protein n=1 Tax=Parachlamydia acanthamoebae TaxID=83552 RepID=UPI003B8496A1